ncbi:FliM/FliN family flagellar motor switch protein [Pseudomonas typographi]|uniref:Flagellar motor switch protein FliN-like C-terminal domain-containing protein n=1 Tax=Pseudomonas typographi TaxID=2715964 RepID=A0ABR7Z204_9PSED|nr:FliM/FliN family flagellar motor switch protein [Pseudomonas typographi]MBD1552387.1 hypothetical protein [Pseudomonas typographi]MBD1587217.1 hypothetical protein [Pseudomonas typographi]MBD1599531.1 hypothetical protein [Pseudomonas typographi]
MTGLGLRTLELQAYRRGQWVRHWLRQGTNVEWAAPPAGDAWLSFRAVGGPAPWAGMVARDPWLRHQWPALPAFLAQGYHAKASLALFASLPRPVETGLAELDYQSLQALQWLPAAQVPREPLPLLHTASGPVWLTQLPAYAGQGRQPLPTWLRQCAQPLRLSLGTSRMPARQWARLRAEDIALIGHLQPRMYWGGRCIGAFTLEKEGLMTQLQTPTAAPQCDEAAFDPCKVTVEFILHRSPLSLAELSEWEPGHLIELPEGAVERVELVVAGRTVGRGELVRLEGRLGIQIHALHGGAPDE